jgi:prevent-host-death family protein
VVVEAADVRDCRDPAAGGGLRLPLLARLMDRICYDRVMKRMSIQDLKARLSGAVAEAESGGTILITRHNEPVAQLSPARVPSVHRGARVGTARLTPATTRATRGRYLTVLLEDRGTR